MGIDERNRDRSSCTSDREAVFLAGSHDGFERIRPPVRYFALRRLRRADLWIVRDEISGQGEHELSVHWQCAPGLACRGGAGSLILFRGASELLDLHVVETADWRFSDGWVSTAYGVREVAQHVSCSVRGVGGARLTTLFCAPGQVLRARLVTDDGAPGISVRWRDRDGVLFFAGCEHRHGRAQQMRWVEQDEAHR